MQNGAGKKMVKMTIREAIEEAEASAMEKAEKELIEQIDERLEEIGEEENNILQEMLIDAIEIDECENESFGNTKTHYCGCIVRKEDFETEIEKDTELGKKLDQFFERKHYAEKAYAYRRVGIGQIVECNYKKGKFHSAENYNFNFEVELTDEEDNCTEECAE